MCFNTKKKLQTVKLRTFGQFFRAEEDERTQEHCHIQHLHSLVSLHTLCWFLNVCQVIPLSGIFAASSRFYSHSVCGLPLISEVSKCRLLHDAGAGLYDSHLPVQNCVS